MKQNAIYLDDFVEVSRTQVPPVGNTGKLLSFSRDGADSTYASDVRVASLLAEITAGSGVSKRLSQIVESVLWTFAVWIHPSTLRERGRFVRSFRVLVQRLTPFDDALSSVQDGLKSEHNRLMCLKLGDASGRAVQMPTGFPSPTYPGYLATQIKRQLARKTRDSFSFFVSLLESKRAWPELGPARLLKTAEGHRAAFAAQPDPLKDDMIAEIRRTAKELFGCVVHSEGPQAGRRPQAYISPSKWSPSPHACLQRRVKDGGAFGLVGGMSAPSVEDARRLGWKAWLTQYETWRAQKCAETTNAAYGRYEDHQLLGRWNRVGMVFISEPAKYRPISLGDGYIYTALQPLQGQMLNAWKRAGYGTMVGELDNLVAALEEKSVKDYGSVLWNSGDFKSATDYLNIAAQTLVLEEVRDHPLARLGAWSMTHNQCVYPPIDLAPKESVTVPPVFQKNGQLMGHPLSFPILCAVNLAAYRVSVDRWAKACGVDRQRHLQQREAVLINGDDILFRCDAFLFREWVKTCGEVGLVMSVGKNYLSSSLAMINSQRYVHSEGRLRPVTYLNLKLIKGFSLKGGESDATPEMIGGELSRMVRGCPRLRGTIPAAFRRFGRPQFGFNPNWYLPTHLGGFGVAPELAPPGQRITREQRQVAAQFVSDARLQIFARISGYAPMMRKMPFVIPLRMAPGPKPFGPPTQSDSLGESSASWAERFSAIGKAFLGPREPVPVLVLARRFIRQGRLHKMSAEGLKTWWVVHDDESLLGPVPPLSPLRQPTYANFLRFGGASIPVQSRLDEGPALMRKLERRLEEKGKLDAKRSLVLDALSLHGQRVAVFNQKSLTVNDALGADRRLRALQPLDPVVAERDLGAVRDRERALRRYGLIDPSNVNGVVNVNSSKTGLESTTSTSKSSNRPQVRGAVNAKGVPVPSGRKAAEGLETARTSQPNVAGRSQ